MRKLICIIIVLLSLSAEAFAQETVTRGPYLQQLSNDSIIIRWRTDIAVGSSVKYATSISNLDQEVSSAALTTEHIVKLTGLQAHTRYYYNVGKPGSTSSTGTASQTFETAPTPGLAVSTSFWILGDSGTANADAGAVRDAYKAHANTNGDADFLIMLGDNAYNSGTDNEYQAAVFDIYPEVLLKTPLWSTLGNHDGYTADSATQSGPYYNIFSLPMSAEAGGVASGTESYYSFDYGNIHFVCLNSYDVDRASDSAMLQWLQSDLAVNDKEWLIAFFHHPPYTKGSHDSDSESRLVEMRENALPLLEAAGVDLVLTGHSHSYERSYLIDGHYDVSSTFAATMQKNAGDGRPSGNGAYAKHSGQMGGNAGAVYAVAGSSGKISGGSLNHPAMFVSMSVLGSMLVDVQDATLSAIFLDNLGNVQDSFTIIHQSDSTPPQIQSVSATSISLVSVTFSEPVQELSAETIGNYSILPDVTVLAANLASDKKTLTLTTSPLSANKTYALLVDNVLDISGNPVPDNSYKTFAYKVTATMLFQNGVSPDATYSDYTDTYLSQQNPTTNYNSDTFIAVDGDDPGGSTNDLAALMRWDISSLPAGAVATSASITVRVTNQSSGTYNLYEALKSWNEVTATWNTTDGSTSWQSSGAQGALDRNSTLLGGISAGSTGNNTTTLNSDGIALINQWISTPASNYGFVLANSTATDGLDFRSSAHSTASTRPVLSITYELGAGAGDTVAPSAPANLINTATGRKTIFLAWDVSTDNVGVVSYGVFRDGHLIAVTAATSITDTGLIPETTYSYTVVAYDSAPNQSASSNSLSVTTLDADTDKDGVDDDQELLDGTDENDPGSFIERLAANSCTEWNGFLSMYNFLELLNRTNSTLPVTLNLYNLSGNKVSSVSLSLPANGQWDHPVHEMPGFSADSYGLLCVSHSAAVGSLWGQMVLYRPKSSSFEFAMSIPLSNGIVGEQTAPVNTYNPDSVTSNAVANWIQLTNHSSSTVSGSLDFYAQDGSPIAGGQFALSLGAKSRTDIAAHQFVGPYIGSARWTPASSNSAATIRSVRYIYDNPFWQTSFSGAAPIKGKKGNGQKQYAPVSTIQNTSVAELVNTSDSAITVVIEYFSEAGISLGDTSRNIAARGTEHIVLNPIFGNGVRGSISMDSSASTSLLASVVQYEFNLNNRLSLLYALPARQALGTTVYSSFNTYVSHTNSLLTVSAISAASTPALTLRALDGTILLNSTQLTLPGQGLLLRDINSDVPIDAYGRIELQTSVATQSSWLLRRRNNEYVLPFEVLP